MRKSERARSVSSVDRLCKGLVVLGGCEGRISSWIGVRAGCWMVDAGGDSDEKESKIEVSSDDFGV